MLGGENKVWLQYRKDILAADVQAASFLSSYLRHMAIHKTYTRHIEVVDLQRYKIINHPTKVKVTVKERGNIPFVFVVGKN